MARPDSRRRHPLAALPAPVRALAAPAAALSALAVGAATALTYARLYFGVDLTDESFYAAVPYRLVLGARPLVDETNVAQLTPGALLYPFVKAYSALAGLDGLILYLRHLHLAFTLAVAWAVFRGLDRGLRDAPASAVVAAIPLAFVPFGIHGLSYNTLASGFFAAGCLVGASAAGDRRALLLAGAAHGLAVFSYPPFAVPVAVFFATLLLVSRPTSLRTALRYLAPLAVCVLGTLAFFLQDGLDTAVTLFRRASTYGGQGGGAAKAWDVASSVVTTFPHPYLAVGLLVAAAAMRRWAPALVSVPLLALPLAALPDDLRTSASSNEFVTSFALLAPAVFLLVRSSGVARTLLVAVWIPAAVAGEVTGFSSGNGAINVAIGFLPGAIVTAALIAVAVRGGWPRRGPIALSRLLPPVAVVAIGVALQYAYVYRDASLSHLTVRIDGGAYAGLRTTPRTRDFLASLERDLAAASGTGCRVVFYDAFPAGYLLGHGTPDTNTALLLDVDPALRPGYERLLLDYYARRGGLPDVAVRIDGIPLSDSSTAAQTYSPAEPLERLFRGPRYQTVATGGDYLIRTRTGARCADG